MSGARGVAVEGSSRLSAGRLGVVLCVGLGVGVGVSQIVSSCQSVWVWPVFGWGGVSGFPALDSL